MVEIDIEKELDGARGPIHLKFSCTENEGVFMSMFGDSGSGKTSILRMICGLMKPDKGVIRFRGETWFDSHSNIDLPPQKRDVGIVFQDYGLFPNMTARGNAAFAATKSKDQTRISAILDEMGLNDLADNHVIQLSGGQQQRVAVARTLVQKPALLLLDEPLSASDMDLRKEMQQLIKKYHDTHGSTTIMISHDREEMMRMSDVVYHLHEGRIIGHGKPLDQLFPRSSLSALGLQVAVLDVQAEDSVRYGLVRINDEIIRIKIAAGVNVGDVIVINITGNNLGV